MKNDNEKCIIFNFKPQFYPPVTMAFRVGILIFTFCILLLTACTKQADNSMTAKYKNIRQPAVAGQFYPADAEMLKFKIDKYLNNVDKSLDISLDIKAIMAPHAGYDFSGPVAAYSYKQLRGRKFNTVVIICNSHTTYFSGVAVDGNDAWQTPLGLIEVDKELAEKLVKSDNAIRYNSNVHIADHTLEVQLPFLQIVLEGDFKILPILFGNAESTENYEGAEDRDYKKLARALADNLGENDIIIISTDMSHYPAYEDANRIDKQTLEIIKSADVLELENHIKAIESQNIAGEQTVLCGVDGVKTIMELYNLLGWDKIEILKYANSGDVAIGNKNSVVGYGAVAFIQAQGAKPKAQNYNSEPKNILNKQQQAELLNIARTAVETYIKDGKIAEFEISDERLKWKEGAFVTIHKDGKLRGCIGQIVPTDKPLWQVVRDMAIAAATEDHRFSPVSRKELTGLNYEVSVLSAPEKIDNWQNIELGRHGVIVKKGWRSGVFLPQVAAETSWSKEEFLAQLCSQKAGLPPDCYKNDSDVELQVFTAQVFGE